MGKGTPTAGALNGDRPLNRITVSYQAQTSVRRKRRDDTGLFAVRGEHPNVWLIWTGALISGLESLELEREALANALEAAQLAAQL